MNPGSRRWRLGRLLWFTVLLSAMLVPLASSAAARTFTVTRADDPPPSTCQRNDCSLREAAIAANGRTGADTIQFARSLSGSTVKLTLGEIRIRGNLAIDGPGATKLAVSGNQQSRVFHMTGGLIAIDGLAITKGRESATANGATCPGDSATAYTAGGGILQDAGRLTLDGVKVSNNSVEGPANTIIGGGGIADIDGRLALTHTRMTGNAVLGGSISGGGGILNCVGDVSAKGSSIHDSLVTSHAIAAGGGIANGLGAAQNTGTVELRKSTVAANDVSSEVISDGGGVATTGGPVNVDASTISDNGATVTGGGSISGGGGLYNANATVTITNSTITQNIASAPNASGGGARAGGIDEVLKLRSVTLVGNEADGTSASRGGNLVGSNSASVRNTIVAKGVATQGSNCDAAVKSSSHDLEDEDTCGFAGNGDLVDTNPKVRDLARNGGPTETIALERQSPAIDHAARKSSPKRDQRGFKRDDKPDIGAYEFGAKP